MANKAMQRSFLGKQVYLRVMGSRFSEACRSVLTAALADRPLPASMKTLLSQHKEAVARYTELDLERIQKEVTYLNEFDREVQ